MAASSRGRRLARRYPLLNSVPEDERPAIVRAALRHPLVLLLVVGGGLLLLPPYLDKMFFLLGVEQEEMLFLKLIKFAAVLLAPVVVAVPLLTRLVLPRFIRQEMRKRGYEDQGPSSPGGR